MRIVFTVAAAAVSVISSATHASPIYGLLNNNGAVQQLVTFDSNSRAVTSSVNLQIGTAINSLSSIAVQPSTGQLYGFTGATDQLYNINTSSGVLTAVGGPFTSSTIGTGDLNFDPTTGLIRLVGTNGGNQNLRVNPTTGGVVSTDSPLTYSAGDSGAGQTPNIARIARGIGSSNTLFGVDATRDVLVTQSPENAGSLETVGALGIDIGSTGQGFGSFTGFDVAADGTAFLTDSAAGEPVFFGGPTATTSDLYTINLGTGAATSDGLISGLPFGRSIEDIAVAGSVPEPASASLIAACVGIVVSRHRRMRI